MDVSRRKTIQRQARTGVVNPQVIELDSTAMVRTRESLAEENRATTHEVTPGAEERVFKDPQLLFSYEDVISASHDGLSGVHLRGGNLVVSTFGTTLRCRDVRFLRLAGRQWHLPAAQDLFQPFRTVGDAIIIPFLGDFYVNGRRITEEELERMGATFLKDAQGGDVKLPAFVSGGRSLVYFGRLKLPGFTTDEGGLCFFDSREELEARLPNSLPTIRQATEESLRQTYEESDKSLTFDEFRRREEERAFFTIVVNGLSQAQPPGAEMLEGVAVQLKGTGLYEYLYHLVRKHPDGRIELAPGEAVARVSGVDPGEDASFAQRQTYEGVSGIPLDVLHQFYDKDPTGGLTSSEADVERDRRLLARGAVMGGVTLGWVVLFTKEQLDKALGFESGMVSPQIVVSLRLVLRDSERLKVLAAHNPNPGEPTEVFKHLIERDYGSSADFEDSMRDYLGRLSGNLGGNMRECLAEGLTVNENQDTADNLTTYGGILDSRDFRRMRNRFQCFPLVFNWIRDLALVAGSAGVRAREFFEGEHYLRLATAFLGREAGARATEGVKRCQRADKLPGYAAMDLARRWVSASLVRD
jgi:hypothetical protein